jgi:hypothetical protein
MDIHARPRPSDWPGTGQSGGASSSGDQPEWGTGEVGREGFPRVGQGQGKGKGAGGESRGPLRGGANWSRGPGRFGWEGNSSESRGRFGRGVARLVPGQSTAVVDLGGRDERAVEARPRQMPRHSGEVRSGAAIRSIGPSRSG